MPYAVAHREDIHAMHVGDGTVWLELCCGTGRCLNGHRYVRTIESADGRVRISKAAGAHAMKVRFVEALPHPKTCIVAHGRHNVMKCPCSRCSRRRPGKIAQADPTHSAVLGRRLVPQANVGDVVRSSANRSTQPLCNGMTRNIVTPPAVTSAKAPPPDGVSASLLGGLDSPNGEFLVPPTRNMPFVSVSVVTAEAGGATASTAPASRTSTSANAQANHAIPATRLPPFVGVCRPVPSRRGGSVNCDRAANIEGWRSIGPPSEVGSKPLSDGRLTWAVKAPPISTRSRLSTNPATLRRPGGHTLGSCDTRSACPPHPTLEWEHSSPATCSSACSRGAGMGVVYLGIHDRLRRPAAVKVLAPELAGDPLFRRRFLRECEVSVAIDHPNIIPVYDAGEFGNELYIAMRYVEGQDLRALLVSEETLSAEQTIAIVVQIASALDHAHSRGLVHRDVKPANVLLSGEPAPHCYLCDFGLSTFGTASSTDLAGLTTSTGELTGTVDYMAPERIAGNDAVPASDLYSLACLAVECLTGRPPFRRPTQLATLWAHMTQRPPPVASDLGLPHAIDTVLSRGLAKEPGQRQQTCSELARQLREAVPSSPRARPAHRRRRWPAVAVAGVVLLGVALIFLTTRSEPTAPDRQPDQRASGSSQPACPNHRLRVGHCAGARAGWGDRRYCGGVRRSGWSPFMARSPASSCQAARSSPETSPASPPA